MKIRAMAVLGACFAMSFVGRLAVFAADSAGAASAESPKTSAANAPSAEPNTESVTNNGGLSNATTCQTQELAATLRNRIAALDAREDTIAEKHARMEAYATLIETRLEELDAANAEMKQYLDKINERRNRDVEQLAAIYNSMKPKLASEILSEMDVDFASGLLAQLETESAAAILAGMEPQKAYTISVHLANQSRY